MFYRAPKQVIASDITVLGGVTLKTPLPTDADALSDFLLNYELRLPPGPLTTIYELPITVERTSVETVTLLCTVAMGKTSLNIFCSYTTRGLLF